ncbi:MAG: AI-2E family transporter, partial [Bacilli bacterium]|nr:AI-2E family transporter [Bacilli bacterium]
YIGPYIGGAAAVIVGFSQGNVIGISVLIICVIVQLVESYILQPVVMSKAMQLHPVTIIIGLLIFGYFFGIIGMVFATPCLALIKVLWRFVRNKYGLFMEKN